MHKLLQPIWVSYSRTELQNSMQIDKYFENIKKKNE